MSNEIISPNMNLPVPVVSQDPGPQWAVDNNSCLAIIDAHNHSSGSGVQINPAGLNINSDLSFGSNNATVLKTVRFSVQASSISNASPNVSCLYSAGTNGDLYFNDSNGHVIQMTNNGSIPGASGTISGLPNGTASAAYTSLNGTYVFQSATSTAANMDIATLILRYNGSYPSPSGNYIAFQVPSSISTGFAFTLPAALPGSAGALITSSTSGSLAYTNVDNVTLKISSNTIAIPSNVSLPGVAQVAGNNIVVSNANAANNLAVIRGYVNSSYGIVSGEGFSIGGTGTGYCQIVFTTAFQDNPAIIFIPVGSITFAEISNVSTANSTAHFYNTSGTLTTTAFMFIAIGQVA